MKKKLIPLILALVCAIVCTFSLAACGHNGDEAIGLWVAKNGEKPTGEEITVNITYGEKPDLDYKLYLSYKNGDTKEIPLTDENLTVSYSYFYDFHSVGMVTIEKLPEEYLAGTYYITYHHQDGESNRLAAVVINVARAGSGAFSIQSTKLTWYENEKTPNVILKNPKDLLVTAVLDRIDVNKSDDSDGCYSLCYVEKQVYDAFTEAQKTDYDFLQNCSDLNNYLSDWNCSVGEYMLFAMVEQTYNYDKVVTPAVKITVKDILVERTFTLQSIVLQDNAGNPVTDEENEFVFMAAALNTENQGKTVICKANGEVRGTVDFGGGVFDEMSAEDVYKYLKFGATGVSIGVPIEDGSFSVIGEGVLLGSTFTLKMPADDTYNFIITFTAQ